QLRKGNGSPRPRLALDLLHVLLGQGRVIPGKDDVAAKLAHGDEAVEGAVVARRGVQEGVHLFGLAAGEAGAGGPEGGPGHVPRMAVARAFGGLLEMAGGALAVAHAPGGEARVPVADIARAAFG